MNIGLEVIIGLNAVPPAEIWELLYVASRTFIDPEQACEIGTKKCRFKDAGAVILNSGKPHFNVAWNNTAIRFTNVASANHALVHFKGLRSPSDCDLWIMPLLDVGCFRQGWMIEEEYNYWQNAEDPLEYTSFGRSYDGLPMKSNNAPPPLEQMVIDISCNPGRRMIRDGYIEAVGSRMWLGLDFWRFVPGSIDDLAAEKNLTINRLQDGVVLVEAAKKPFQTASGAEGQLQQTLRELLYHE